MRKLRLKAVWVLVLPFLWFARPTPVLLVIGGALAAFGLLVRGWAAGTIHKEEDLTTSGPYAYTRNPLYLGTLFIGMGVTVAGGQWIWPVAFLVFFAGVYGRTMAGEAELLGELFGDRYEHYASGVPAFLPRLTAYRAPLPDIAGGFRWSQYGRNREWEALLGGLATFAFLTARWWLG